MQDRIIGFPHHRNSAIGFGTEWPDSNWEITNIGLFAEKTVLGGGLAKPFCP